MDLAYQAPRDDFLSRIEALAATTADPVAGFFGPDSMTWKVNREGAIYLGGMRALLMQIAHPCVAQGVADHSDFRHDPLARLRRTFDTVHAMVFGMQDTAVDAAVRLHEVHEQVRGLIDEYPAGGLVTEYYANDPELLLWVYATLVDSSIYAYQTFLPNLSVDAWERYYEESKIFAQLCGVPYEMIPPTIEDFYLWMGDKIDGRELAIRQAGSEVAEALLAGPPLLWPLRPGNYVLAAGMLPSRLREEFGLSWNIAVRSAYSAGVAAVRTGVAVLPTAIRTLPVARRAERRCRNA